MHSKYSYDEQQSETYFGQGISHSSYLYTVVSLVLQLILKCSYVCLMYGIS